MFLEIFADGCHSENKEMIDIVNTIPSDRYPLLFFFAKGTHSPLVP